MTTTDKLAEALQDGLSVCNSVSMAAGRRVVIDGCVLYAQTEEWCQWAKKEVRPRLQTALNAHDAEQAAKAVPAGFVLVPVEVLEDAATAIGHFLSDHGWSADDMQAMDNLDAYIAGHKANAAAPALCPAPAEQAQAGGLVAFALSPVDIYDFAGWLTTRPGTMTVGSSQEAGPMAEAVGEYLRTFPERFTTPPAPEAQRMEPLTDGQLSALLKEARKIIRASSSRSLAKDWDRRATQALAGATTGEKR